MPQRRWVTAVVILLIAALGLWLRGNGAGSHGLYLDEFATTYAAQAGSPWECTRRVYSVIPNGPPSYLASWLSFRLFGESELALRLPALVCGLLLPLAAWRGFRSAGLARAGAAAALILAANPVLVFYGRQARPYALALLGAAIAHWGLARSLRSGRAADRGLAWFGAVLAGHSHPLYMIVPGALFIAALTAPRGSPYGRRALVRDALTAGLLLLPPLLHTISLMGHETLSWAHGDLTILAELWPGGAAALAVGAGWMALRVANRSFAWPAWLREPGRALFVLELLLFVLPVLATVVLSRNGANLYFSRYLLLAVLGGGLLLGRLAGGLPAPLAGCALACLLLAPGARAVRTGFAWSEWRDAAAELESLDPAPTDPILLLSGLAESQVAYPPFQPSVDLQALLSSPLGSRPGHIETRSYLLLPYHWGVSGNEHMTTYAEKVLVPGLSNRPRIYVVADESTWRALDKWLDWRFDGAYRVTHLSRPFFDGPRVIRYTRQRR